MTQLSSIILQELTSKIKNKKNEQKT